MLLMKDITECPLALTLNKPQAILSVWSTLIIQGELEIISMCNQMVTSEIWE